MRKRTLTLVRAIACALLFNSTWLSVEAQVNLDIDPRTCGFPCTSNDVIIGNAFLAADINGTPLPSTCIPGDPVSAFICVEATNKTGSTRTKLIVAADIYIDGIFLKTIKQCIDVNLPNNVLAKFCLPNSLSWTCGSAVELKSVYVGFYAAGGSDSCPSANGGCASYNQPAKCIKDREIIVNTPLIVDFSYTCTGFPRTMQLTDQTSGGVKPYVTHEWNFGDGSPVSNQTNPLHQFPSSTGVYTVTLKVTDNKGNMDTQSYEVDLKDCCQLEVECPDALAPGAYDCKTPIPDPINTVAAFESTFNVDIGDNPCGTIVIKSVDSPESINICNTTQVIRTYTIFDDLNDNGILDSGEAFEVCSITYNFTPDQTPPEITKGAINNCYSSVADAETDALAATTASDNCTNVANIQYDVTASGVCNVTIKVTATDQCGKSSFVEYQTLIDNAAPTFTSCPESSIDLGCNPTSFPTKEEIKALVGAQDNCGLKSVEVSAGAVSGDCNKSQTFTVTAKDNCDQTSTCKVTYVWTDDPSAPTFTSCPESSIDLGCNPTSFPTKEEIKALVGAQDNCGLKSVEVSAGAVSGDCNKSQTFTVTAKDNCDQTSTCKVTHVWTEDVEAPMLVSCPESKDLGCNPDPSEYASGIAMWTDNCGFRDVGVREGIPSLDEDGCSWSVTHEYYAIDKCGKESTCWQTFTWKIDTEVPKCFYNGPIPELTCEEDVVPDLTGFIVKTDNCSLPENITVVQSPAPGSPMMNSLMVTFTVTDECNNSSTCEFALSCLPPDIGCTYTPGYWKNHPQDICIQSIPCVGDPLTAVKGTGSNPWTILARAYAAAYLNHECADARLNSIQEEFDKATILLCTYDATYAGKLKGAARSEWTQLAGIIDQFNNGLIGPPHCDGPLSPPNQGDRGPNLNTGKGMNATAFPNPFARSTTIRFVQNYDSEVLVEIFNTAGQKVKTLFSGQVAANVWQDVEFSTENVASEVYFYRITSKEGTIFGKLISKK